MPGLITVALVTPVLYSANCGSDVVPSTSQTSLDPSSFVCLFGILSLVKRTYKLEFFQRSQQRVPFKPKSNSH